MTTSDTSAATGMRAFLVVWGGQLISVTGTTVSGFALQFWVFLETGSVTDLALVTLAFMLPATLLAPFAGALVDRWDRRLVMIGADTLAAAATIVIAVLYATDSLQIWHLYGLAGVGAVGNAFQNPAWMAAMPTLVPKKHLGRANGMTQLIEGVSFVLGPVIAGAVLAVSGLGAVLIIDIATFCVAVGTLLVVRFPRVAATAPGERDSLMGEVKEGWRFLRERRGLLWLLWMYAGVNFVMSFTNVLIIPMLLTVAGESAAGTVFSVGGLGLVAGSIVMSVWGGPRHRIAGIMFGIAATGLFLAVAGLRPNVVLIAIGFILMLSTIPMVNTSSQVLWQVKVPLAMQGRVFALRRTVAGMAAPIAVLLAGPLADHVFEPLLAPGGGLAGTVGRIIGTGTGRGIGLMVILSGVGVALLGLVGWSLPRVRHLEEELPDHLPDEAADGAPGGAGEADGEIPGVPVPAG